MMMPESMGLFRPGQIVTGETSRQDYRLEGLLGQGGQGEVYRAAGASGPVAVKWYYGRMASPAQQRGLREMIAAGPPSARFLWPIELAAAPDIPGFGYVMALRPSRFCGASSLMRGREDVSLRTITRAGYLLADSFFQLHAKGLCYRDISFGNVFFDSETGDVLICDTDNVTVDGSDAGTILGTPRFMAPEIVRGEANPSSKTDLYSLAVLLFQLLMVHHPLEGKRESTIDCFDREAMNHLYGEDPRFIFDPKDDANAPDPRRHRNAIDHWSLYPAFIRDLFIRAFTDGLTNPEHGRVRESEWRAAMVRLGDLVVECSRCGAERCFDPDAPDLADGGECWNPACHEAGWPPRIHVGDAVVVLETGVRLYPHHLSRNRLYGFDAPLAEVVRHPDAPEVLGLKNLSTVTWKAVNHRAERRTVPPGRTMRLGNGVVIRFGEVEGVVWA